MSDIYQQPVLEKLTILRSHMIDIERDNIIPDLKLPISEIIGGFNRSIAYYKRQEEKEKNAE